MNIAVFLAPLLGTGVSEERPFPEVPLVHFTATEARALDDFLGQVVLVDFFAHWCAPCARLVPHLNELAEGLGEHGLHVLGVTGDDAATAREWIARHDAAYPHARDAGLALQIELGFRPLPFAVLVDTTGTIAWTGNPGELPTELVEGLLEEALEEPAMRWPAAAQPLRESLRARRFGEALERARELGDSGAEHLRFVERFVARRGALLEGALAAGDVLAAEELATELESGLADGPLRVRAREVRERLASDAAAQHILAGQRALRALWSGVGDVGTVAAADELAARIHELAAAHPDTAVARAAERHLRTVEALKSVLP